MNSFKAIQQAFMQHIKDPKQHAFDMGIEDRRLKIYRELFFNNILGFLDSGFPVLKSLYQPDHWKALARQFFQQHDCRSPYFVDISKEFVEYLSNEHQRTGHDPIFMPELAHYEWLELDVSIRHNNEPLQTWQPSQGMHCLQFSPLASLVSYQYPVHKISQDFQPTEPGEMIYLVVYRDKNEQVQFTLLNAVSAFLLNTVIEHDKIEAAELTQIMAQAMPQLSNKQLEDSMMPVLEEFLQQQVLISSPQ